MNRKYANDYKECQEISGQGNRKKKYIYVGPYYMYEFQTDKRHMMVEYLILTAALTAVWVAAGLLNNAGSRFALTVMPYAVGFIPIFYLICGVLSSCCIKDDKLERCQYDASYRRVRRSINGVLAAAGITAAGDLVFLAWNYTGIDMIQECIFLVCVTAAGVLAVMVKNVSEQNTCNTIDTGK